MNDPYYRTIGIGTRIFLGGGIGYVVWHGTQHNPVVKRNALGIPLTPAGTLALMGDVKQMSDKWLRGVSLTGYGVSLAIGVGIPIPIVSEEMLSFTAARDKDISTQVIDYSQKSSGIPLGEVNYAQLRSGSITIKGKSIPTGALSSYVKAKEIAETLKCWIEQGEFFLAEPAALIPSTESDITFKPLKERPVK